MQVLTHIRLTPPPSVLQASSCFNNYIESTTVCRLSKPSSVSNIDLRPRASYGTDTAFALLRTPFSLLLFHLDLVADNRFLRQSEALTKDQAAELAVLLVDERRAPALEKLHCGADGHAVRRRCRCDISG